MSTPEDEPLEKRDRNQMMEDDCGVEGNAYGAEGLLSPPPRS
jgi:hypothetical protein